MALAEINKGPLRTKLGAFHWRNRRWFVTQNNNASGYATAMWNALYPGSSGAYAPRVRRIDIHEGWICGLALLTCHYWTLRQPGKAQVFLEPSGHFQEITKDLDGEIIVGPDPDGFHHWRLTKGAAKVWEHSCDIVVKAAMETLDLSLMIGKWGKTNSHTMSRISSACTPGTMLLKYTPAWRVWEDEALWYVNFPFAFNPNGWNNTVESQKCIKIAREVARKELDVLSLEQVSLVETHFIPDYMNVEYTSLPPSGTSAATTATEPESRRTIEATSFADIEALVSW